MKREIYVRRHDIMEGKGFLEYLFSSTLRTLRSYFVHWGFLSTTSPTLVPNWGEWGRSNTIHILGKSEREREAQRKERGGGEKKGDNQPYRGEENLGG